MSGYYNINVGLKSIAPLSYTSEYLHMLQSNAFSNLMAKPTRVSEISRTIIDHNLTNDSESMISPKVLLYKISDHFRIICAVDNRNLEPQNLKF